MEGIKGKVAEIIDEYTVVINRGHKDGVEEIKDPDGGSLGKFEYVKAKVEVVNVQEKFSTAETYVTHTMIIPAIQALSGQTTRNKLTLDDETKAGLQKGLRPSVKIGDLVRQILD
jgi:hypothetical protein